ncbi:MAG: hypothetical protein ACYTEW_20825 [Planctomycetota bacterium]|jgi:hypothetical protein
MAVPTINGSGAHAAGTGATTLAVPYPATINSGDLLILHIGGLPAGNDPSGWTKYSNTTDSPWRSALYWKVATGSESGDETLTGLNSGAVYMARIWRVTGGNNVADEAVSFAASKDVGHPSITTSNSDSLVLMYTGINDDETAVSFTGETGGDLTLTAQDTTALDTDYHISLQEVDLASTGTIAGGTWSYAGATETWLTRGIAVYPTAGPGISRRHNAVSFAKIRPVE